MKEYSGEEQQKIIDKNVKGIHEYNKKHPIHMKSTPRSKALKRGTSDGHMVEHEKKERYLTGKGKIVSKKTYQKGLEFPS